MPLVMPIRWRTCRAMNPYVQQCVQTACKPSGEGSPSLAVTAPRAQAPVPGTSGHGRTTASVSAFAFQGTNAHAVLEVLDSLAGRSASVLDRCGVASSHLPPVWQRTAFWLLPPASLLLSQCRTVGQVAGLGAGARVVLQGRLGDSAVAALVLGAGPGGCWALAAEAACAAAASLAAVYDGRRPHNLALAAATLMLPAPAPVPSCLLSRVADLSATVDARDGAVMITAGTSRIMSAASVTVPDAPSDPSRAQRQQRLGIQSSPARLIVQARRLATSDAGSTADLDAPAAWDAQHQSGLFLQPELLLSGSQLLQLPTSTLDGELVKEQLEPLSLSMFDLLLPGGAMPGTCSRSPGSYGKPSRLWRASTANSNLRMNCSKAGSICGMFGARYCCMAGSRTSSCTSASTVDTAASPAMAYTTVWHLMHPVASGLASELSARSCGLQSAVLALFGGGAERHGSIGPCLDVGSKVSDSSSVCAHAMQLLQTAVEQGSTSFRLMASAPRASPQGPAAASRTSSVNAATSSSLAALLRCAANELPAVRFESSSRDELDAEGNNAVPVNSYGGQSFGCFGLQHSAGTMSASRLLPAASPGSSTQLNLSSSDVIISVWAISGGTGALGMLTASWMQQEQQTTSILLLGRTGRVADGTTPDWLLHGSVSACVTLHQCDAAFRADTAAAVGPTATSCSQPIQGLFHAGGILRDASLQQQTAAGICAVHAPKTVGLLRLGDAAASAAPLHQAVLFSSIAAVTGPAGSTSYAAANAALDAAVDHMRITGNASAKILHLYAWLPSHREVLKLIWLCFAQCPVQAWQAPVCSGAHGLPLAWWQRTRQCSERCFALVSAWFSHSRGWLP